MFTTIGKAGGSEPAHLEGLSRMVSLCLRSGIAASEIVDQLSGITSEPFWDNGVLIRSAEDGLAQVLKRYLQEPGVADVSSIPKSAAAQLGMFNGGAHADSANGDLAGVRAECPKCSGRVIHQEGCLSCLDCGYTKCE